MTRAVIDGMPVGTLTGDVEGVKCETPEAIGVVTSTDGLAATASTDATTGTADGFSATIEDAGCAVIS